MSHTHTHPHTHMHTYHTHTHLHTSHRRLETEPDTPTVQEQLAADLWEAVENDDVSKVRSVLGRGANPNHQLYWSEEWSDKYIIPPVHLACYQGCLEITRALVSGGADIEKGGGASGMTAFHWACGEGHMETVVYLSQEMKCHIDVRNKWNYTPLHSACVNGYIQVVKYLVEVLKVDVDMTDDHGRTPLDKTVLFGRTEVADYLRSLQPSTPKPDTLNGSEQLLHSNSIVDKTSSMTSDPLSGQQTPSAGNEQPETTDTPNGSKQLPSTSKEGPNLTSSKSKALNESTKSEQALNEAMKAGFVRVNITNLLFFGMAGTGKTSTKHLLLGLPPPVDRNSTPLASTAERICIRQIRDTTKLKMEAQEDPSRTWKPVTSDDLQRIVADAIKSHVTSSDPASAIPQELSIALKQLEPSNESSTPVDATPSTSRATKPLVAGAKKRRPKQKRKTSKYLNTVSNVMANIQQFSDADRTTVQEKFGSNWIYIIDSGGQPHFHNLLPLFMPKISVALYILRLSDCLDDHPLVEYYKDKKPVGEGFKSHLSVLDNFKYLVQSIQSHSENCKLVCIGTHKDHQSECKETVSDKNRTLLNFAENDESTFFFNLRKKDVIFPVDCKHCDSDSKEVAKTIREYVHKELNNIEILVPFWWFVLEIIVEKVSNDQSRKVLSKTECVEIAKTLHNFHEDALFEALKFFHEHHIFHYYPAILPNVVFCDTQVLLDKVTELVEYAAYLRGSNTPIHGSGKWLKFTDKGIITIELLSDKNFEKHYVDGLFAPTHLIEIFKHLLIATPFGIFSRRQDKRFYMPSLLSLLPSTQVNDKRAELLKTSLIPLVLHFKSNWQCCGVFCCLQVYLIKECEWEIEMYAHQPSRNFVQLIHQKRNCTITLIDGFSMLEIHSSNNQTKILSLIFENIHSGLRSAYKVLKYAYEDPEVAFLCPCISRSISSPSPQVPHHPARVLAEDDVMRCTLCKKTYELEDGHKDWLSACKLEDPLASGQRKRSLPSDEQVETLPKRPKNDVIVQVRTDPLASGQRKRSLPSDVEVESLSKRPKNDVTVQGSSSEKDTSNGGSTHQSIVLTGDDIQAIRESLKNASKDWFDLGLAFGVKINVLENIEDDYRHNDRRLMKVVAKRLEVTDPEHPMTWPYICECLRRPTVARNDVAEEIEDKYVRTATAVAHSATN
ncbi:uncharacterized protein LOC135352342 isoform X2 [Halichondria panicea]|uniref:uncharacterized protein LOC135352342 isoform X2 n=1 Tax=Halichondria panicea TaxID=6063 RepID=UPI00312B70CA